MKYYRGGLRIAAIYLLSCFLIFAFEKFYLHNDIGLRYVFGSIVNGYCGYGWYLLLYFGLFLMIPFLNLMYHGLKTRKQKLCLVVTFYVLSILPSLLNLYIQLYSLWWKNLFPICYYFTGAYLSEFKPQCSVKRCLLLLVAAMLAFTGFNVLYFHGDGLPFSNVSFEHFEVYTTTVLLFVIMLCVNAPAAAGIPGRIFTWISELSFAAYLCSWIPDGIIYPIFVRFVPDFYSRFPWTIPLALLSLFGALLLAQVVQWLYVPISKLADKLVDRLISRLGLE